MKQKETIRSLWMPTARPLDGARRVAMLLLTTLLLTMTAQTGRSASRALTLSQFAIWYVDANAASGGDGKNEETAFQTLKEVLLSDEANDGDVIMIASGTYTGDQNIGLTINKSLSFEKYLPPVYTQDEVVFDTQDQGNIWTVQIGIDIDISDFTFKNGTITNYGTLTISKSLTLDNSTIKNYGTVQISDGQVLKYTDDGGQVHLLCGTLDADAISALANKDITFFGYGGHCGQDNPETTDVDESKNVMWCISPDDPATADIDESKVLTISGTGLMMYYNSIQNADATWSNGAPWKAFANDIEKVIIKDGITYVGSNTFAHCPNISSVTLPESGLYQIGPGAFADCTSLTSIDIPMSVNNIGDQAFAGCSNLETVSIGYGEAASFTIGTEVFPATTTIFVPKASLSGYLAATDWSTYQIAPAILKSIVTQDNFSNFFDESGNLKDKTSDELIFQGEFANLVDYILLDRSITITGDNAVSNNMGFAIVSDDVSLNNMTLVSNTDLGYLIYVDASNVTLDNLSVTYNAPSEVEAKAIFANDADNFKLTNSEITFTGANPGEDHYRGLEVRNCDGAVIDKNTITATFPAVAVDWGAYGKIDQNLVLAVGIQGGDDVEFTNNVVTVNTNGDVASNPTIDAVMVHSANDILIKGNTITLMDATTEDGPRYYYSLDIYSTTGTVEANDITVNTTTTVDRAGTAYLIQLTGPFTVTVKDNNLTGISKGSITGIYATSNWSGEGESNLTVENNNIDVTGYVTTSNYDLVSGIEAQIDMLKAYNNTITVANGADYDDANHVYGVSMTSTYVSGTDTPVADINGNNMTVDGKYAVYYKEAEDTEVTGNALCAHELFGDAAVFIESGDNNTVENNILGYVIPKTGENTYNIPANVSSFKVYDDGGKGRIYSPGCDGTLTLTAPEGYVLQLSGNIKTEKDVDYLTVYDGSSNQADVLINQVSSSVSGELTDIPTVTSTGQSMTLHFYSDNSDSGNSEFHGLDLTVTLGKNIAACNITVPNQTMERFGGGDPYPYIYFKFEDAENNPTSNVIGEVVKDGETTLTLGTDYEFGQITFAEPSTHDEKVNPCKPGDKCLVEIIGLGTYVGTAYADFTIISPSANGTYGDLSWSVADGTLSITGTGAMTAAATTAYPWYQYCSIITSVTIGDGVTSIADNAFGSVPNMYTYNNVAKVTIPASVTSIGADAFKGCITATDVYCYADPTKLTWGDTGDDFKSGKETKCHVADADAWSSFSSVNVAFVGDLAEKSIPYIDANGNMAYCTGFTVIDGEEGMYDAGWYVVKGNVTKDDGGINFTGEAHIILADGASLTLSNGSLCGFSHLTIYGQTAGNGTLATYSDGSGIKTNSLGNLTINGGIINAKGGAIEVGGNLLINGGTLTGTSTNDGYGLYVDGTISINGGQVTAKGQINSGGDLAINGGQVTATGQIAATFGNITLGWTNSTDQISASQILTGLNTNTVSISNGKAFTDGTKAYTSATSSDDLKALENVTLRPVTGVTLTNDGEGKLTATLDPSSEEEVNIPVPVEVDHVNVDRIYVKDKASTIYLPFSIAYDKVLGGTFNKFKDVDETTTPMWTVKYEEVTSTVDEGMILANTPYIFLPDDTQGGKIVVNNGTDKLSVCTANPHTTTHGQWEFIGTHKRIKWTHDTSDPEYSDTREAEIGSVYGFAANESGTDHVGDFVKVGNNVWINPERAYLKRTASSARAVKSGEQTQQLPDKMKVVIISASGTTTEIGTLDTRTGEISLDEWYSLDGHRLSGKPTTKGVYINNGKKVAIK